MPELQSRYEVNHLDPNAGRRWLVHSPWSESAGAKLFTLIWHMSSHFQSSGPRSNAYSESKFTNWAIYDPFFAEARSAYKRFDDRLPSQPDFPHIVTLPPLTPDFLHPVQRNEVEHRMKGMPLKHL